MDLNLVLELLENHRFVAAHAAAGQIWDVPSERIDRADWAVALGRIALRLGGLQRAQQYWTRARNLDPNSDEVLVWGTAAPAFPDPVGWLQDIETQARPMNENLARSKAGSLVGFFAGIRLFDRAEAEFQNHGGEASSDGWMLYAGAFLRMNQDRWAEAWALATASWAISPGYPLTAEILLRVGIRAGRPAEWPQILWEGPETPESYQLEHCRFQAASLMFEEGDTQRDWLTLARQAAANARTAAVLAEDSLSRALDQVAIDAETLTRHVTPSEPFKRYFQDYNQCVPASLATVLSVWGSDATVQELAEAMTWGGTQTIDAIRALRKRGWWVRVLSVGPQEASALLQASIPFTISIRSESLGHSLAVVGHTEDGSLLVHDPDGLRMVSWQLPESGDPTEGLVVLPAHRADLQALVPVGDSAEVETFLEFLTCLEDGVPVWNWNAGPGYWEERARIHWLIASAQVEEALQKSQAWETREPQSIEARKMTLHIQGLLPDRRAYRRELRSRQDQGSVFALAEDLSRSALDRNEARHLWCALAAENGRNPTTYLGLTRWALNHNELATALFASEIGYALEQTSEALAQVRAQVLITAGKKQEADDFLRQRVLRWGTGFKGSSVLKTWLDMVKESDRSSQWILAQNLQPLDARLVETRAVEDESDCLTRLSEAAKRLTEQGAAGGAARLEALRDLATPNGNPLPALEEWAARRPWDQGPWAWLKILQPNWQPPSSHPQRTLFLYQEAARQGMTDEAERCWKTLISNDPWNGWLWREEAFRQLGELRKQHRLADELLEFEAAVDEAAALDPKATPTLALVLEREWLRNRQAQVAVDGFFKLWRDDPEYDYAANRLLALLEPLPQLERWRWLDRVRSEIEAKERSATLGEAILEAWCRWKGPLAAFDLAQCWAAQGSGSLSLVALDYLRWDRLVVREGRWADLVQERLGTAPPGAESDRLRAEAALADESQTPITNPAVFRLSVNPRDMRFRILAIRSLWQDGRIADGWRLWWDGLSLPALDVSDWSSLANLALTTSRGPRVFEAWARAPERIRGSVGGLLAKAHWEQRLQRRGDAEETLTEAITMHPEDSSLLVALARLLDDGRGADDKIIALLTKVHTMDAAYWEAADFLACYQEKVLDVYQDPRHGCLVAAEGRRAWIRYRDGDRSSALSILESLLRDQPGYPWAQRLLAAWCQPPSEQVWLLALQSPPLWEHLWEQDSRSTIPDTVLNQLEGLVALRPVWGYLLGPAWIDLVQERTGPEAAQALLHRWSAEGGAVRAYTMVHQALKGELEADEAWEAFEGCSESAKAPWEWRAFQDIGTHPEPGFVVEALCRRIVARQTGHLTAIRAVQVLGTKGDELFVPCPEPRRVLGWTGGPAWPSRLLDVYLEKAPPTPTFREAKALAALIERVEDQAVFSWMEELQPRLGPWLGFDTVWERHAYHQCRKTQRIPRYWWVLRQWQKRDEIGLWSVANLQFLLARHPSPAIRPPRWVADPLVIGVRALETITPDSLVRWMVSQTIDLALRRGKLDSARSLARRYRGLWDQEPQAVGHVWPDRWAADRTLVFTQLVKALGEQTMDPLASSGGDLLQIPLWLPRAERQAGLVSSRRIRSVMYWKTRWDHWAAICKEGIRLRFGRIASSFGLIGLGVVVILGATQLGSGALGLGILLAVVLMVFSKKRQE